MTYPTISYTRERLSDEQMIAAVRAFRDTLRLRRTGDVLVAR